LAVCKLAHTQIVRLLNKYTETFIQKRSRTWWRRDYATGYFLGCLRLPLELFICM